MIRFCTLAAATGFVLVAGIHASSADPLPTETHRVLPAALSLEAAQAALAACKAQGYNVTVSVVDRMGLAQILIVGDNASPTGRGLAPRKAYTSAIRKITTGELGKRVAVPGAFNPLAFDPLLTTERGAVPITVDKDTIGAIGVSGAPGGEKDEACAEAGIAKISDRLQ